MQTTTRALACAALLASSPAAAALAADARAEAQFPVSTDGCHREQRAIGIQPVRLEQREEADRQPDEWRTRTWRREQHQRWDNRFDQWDRWQRGSGGQTLIG